MADSAGVIASSIGQGDGGSHPLEERAAWQMLLGENVISWFLWGPTPTAASARFARAGDY